MRLLRTLAPIACVLAALVARSNVSTTPRSAQPPQQKRAIRDIPWHVDYAAPGDANYRYGPTRSQTLSLMANVSPSSTFVPTYTGFSGVPGSQAAFQAALDIWGQTLVSSVPIRVRATFKDLGNPLVLGQARTAALCFGPTPNTIYSAALADKLSGTQSCAASNGETTEIIADFNSTFANWDFGTSGTGVNGKYNFMTVVLHEVGHGLGFYGSALSSGGVGFFNYVNQGFAGTFDIYDRFIENNVLQPIIGFASPSAALHAQLISNNLFFNGPNARNMNSGLRPKIESHDMTAFYGTSSDNGFKQGSSYSHVDDSLYSLSPNGLMTWQLQSNEVYTDPGPIMRGMFQDEGWTLTSANCTYSVIPTIVGVGPGVTTGGQIQLTTQAGCPWSAVSGNTAIATITSAASGTGPTTVTYNVSANGSVGPRSVTLTIAGQTVTINQNGTGPTMTLSRGIAAFAAVSNGSAFTSQTGAQTIRMTQTGAGTVNWTATANQPYVVVSPTSGSGSTTFTISVQFAPGLVAHNNGTISIALSGAGNTVGPISVPLTVMAPGTTAAPVGAFDTPANGSTGIAGSIGVTGWSLDDVQTTRVTICRDYVTGEAQNPDPNCGNAIKSYIGDATFVDGARPDVQSAFPTLPMNTRGGWGYLMLTNFLPNLGNGTFTLYAYAYDPDGHVVALPSPKTITCDNSHSTAPFGALDTPGQGATVTGTLSNTGWVLSPNPFFADPPDGGTVRVQIDGIDRGAPPTGLFTSRSDLHALFPQAQYPGVDSALGIFGFDTTTLPNGVHTIAWIVTDNNNVTSGVGSRFFTISNGSGLFADPGGNSLQPVRREANVIPMASKMDVPQAALARMTSPASLTSEVDGAPADFAAIWARRGFDLDRPLQVVTASHGRFDIQSEELDRVELRLSGRAGHHYAGYLRTVSGLMPLPVGSTLDPSTGAFTWMPGVGFVGGYDLVFVRWSGGTPVARQDVHIVLNPKGSNRVGPQTVIDIPGENRLVGQPFFLAGWAADLDAVSDSGVSAIHVWAYPLDAAGNRLAPSFLGTAVYGGPRPDVAAIFGERFGNSGYGMSVAGLEPGTYDIAVFAFSSVVGNFTPAKVVRVTVR